MGIEQNDVGFELLTSEHCKFGYAREEFVDKAKLPIVIFSKVWAVLKEEPVITATQEVSSPLLGLLPIGQHSDKQLLEKYDMNCSTDVEDELKRRSKGRRFIVLEDDSVVNINQSLRFLKLAKKQDMPESWGDESERFTLYKIGEWPNVTYDICPVTGEVLVANYCSQLGINWNGVDDECRQFIKMMTDDGIKLDIMSVVPVMDMAKTGGIESLKGRFANIATKFDQAKNLGKLPILKTDNPKSPGSKRIIQYGNGPKVIRH